MHLGIAALAAALVGALLDAGVLLSRVPWCGAPQLAAAASGALLVFGGLGMALGAIAAVAGRLLPPERAAELAGRPFLVFADLWLGTRRGVQDPEARSGAPWAWLAGKAAALISLSGVFYWVVHHFHESCRVAIAAACVGLPIALGVDRAVRFAVGAAAGGLARLWRPSDPRRRAAARRISCGLLIAGLAAPLAWIAAERERLFGAFDPSALAVVACAVAAASAASAVLFLRRARGGIGRAARPRRVIAAGAVALGAGLILLSASSPSRQALGTRGALGEEILWLLKGALDPDRDRSAWLLGGDCHPFDPSAHPLATERPGNGYDENCDGSDQEVPHLAAADPLDGLPSPPGLARKNGNVLVLLLDAAARDHLSLYGAARPTTPYLDRFAKSCSVFDNFFAASNHTALSLPSLLTGLQPSAFRGAVQRTFAAVKLSSAQLGKSLQRRLSAAGYTTRMLAGHRMSGFTGGFDKLDRPEERSRTPASRLEARLVAALRDLTPRPEKPALVVAHYMDAHHPYEAPEKPTRFGTSERDRYDAELRYVDDHLSRVLALMDEEGFREWLVVVTSDHGEAFHEHGTRYHGESLYDEEIRVPLVIRAPGATARRVATPAGHLDLLPTVIEWTGLPQDPALPGRSLLGLIAAAQDPPGRRIVFTEFFRRGIQVSAHDGRYAFSYNLEDDFYELYDGKTDPGEQKNLYGVVEDPILEAAVRVHAAETLHRLEENEPPAHGQLRHAKEPARPKRAP